MAKKVKLTAAGSCIYSPLAPVQSSKHQGGQARRYARDGTLESVGTLATHALAPAPVLKESFVAAEKMEPAFKVCAPCSLAAQSPAISARDNPPALAMATP